MGGLDLSKVGIGMGGVGGPMGMGVPPHLAKKLLPAGAFSPVSEGDDESAGSASASSTPGGGPGAVVSVAEDKTTNAALTKPTQGRKRAPSKVKAFVSEEGSGEVVPVTDPAEAVAEQVMHLPSALEGSSIR